MCAVCVRTELCGCVVLAGTECKMLPYKNDTENQNKYLSIIHSRGD